MKKIILSLSLVAISLVFILSCSKESGKKAESSEAFARKIAFTKNDQMNGSFTGIYDLEASIGHKAENCNGACSPRHMSCQGHGSECKNSGSVGILNPSADYQKSITSYEAVAMDEYSWSTEEEFIMPNRSFQIIDESNQNNGSWLNIPAQILKRNENNRFVFKGITYTNTPLFENL